MNLGDYLKEFENVENGRKCLLGQPLLVRLDGRAFHTFTKDLKRPYDTRLSTLMSETSVYLVKHTQAHVAYTQSDEITLAWYLEDNRHEQKVFQRERRQVPPKRYEYFFDGRFQKLSSICAAMASTYFNKNLAKHLPEKANLMPIFDARAWSVPTLNDAYLNFLWREQDAIKNSITMAALALFPHKKLQNVNGLVKKQMLKQAGAPWEDMPTFFKRGVYVKRVDSNRLLTAEECKNIPIEHRPTGPTLRSDVQEVFFPELSSIENPEKYLFSKSLEENTTFVLKNVL
jgi:tRNA(His) 5'-end guanylyltransferase